MNGRCDVTNDGQGLSRRKFLIGAGVAAAGAGLLPGMQGIALGASAALPPMPTRPLDLTIIDVAGQLQLTKAIIDDYAKAHAQYVGRVDYETATAPELPAKIKAQQQANQVQIDMVLTGSDALSAGVVQGIWTTL